MRVGISVLLVVLLAGCASSSPDVRKADDWKEYPTAVRNGKRVRLVPASDYLMRNEVPIPVAPREAGTSIQVSVKNHRAWLYQDGALVSVSTVCTGREGFDTKRGTFKVTSKHENWISTIYHVPMPFFLRLNGSTVGLHEGIVALEGASHGCIRLPNGKAEEFFRATPVGATVVITED